MSQRSHNMSHSLQPIEVKSKFDAEFRRFSVSRNAVENYDLFRARLLKLHGIEDIPFTLCYTDQYGDLLPINNDDNFKKALECARPVLRLLIQRKGESWEEKYGYGVNSLKKKSKLTQLIGAAPKTVQKNYSISMPEDFRQVSAIIDVDVIPEQHRRVKLCKHGSDKPLGFYIRDGTSVRITMQGGVEKVMGIFISRLVPGGLAESTGLLAVNDEVLEVNGIEVSGKSLDQVTDMMVANSANLIITVKPANQKYSQNVSMGQQQQNSHQQQQQQPTARRGSASRSSQMSHDSDPHNSYYNSDDEDDDTDLIHDHTQKVMVASSNDAMNL